uniref:Transmembrane protein n=1 Tax=Syphacia muris TaxID=451379 RepID=A0A0N5AHC5_9BILA
MIETIRIREKYIVESGRPISCYGFQWISGLLSSYSCQEYYNSLHSSGIYWNLNVIQFGRSIGAFLNNLLEELYWPYQISAFCIVFTCTFFAIFSRHSHDFSFFYGMVRVTPSRISNSLKAEKELTSTTSDGEFVKQCKVDLLSPKKVKMISLKVHSSRWKSPRLERCSLLRSKLRAVILCLQGCKLNDNFILLLQDECLQ